MIQVYNLATNIVPNPVPIIYVGFSDIHDIGTGNCIDWSALGDACCGLELGIVSTWSCDRGSLQNGLDTQGVGEADVRRIGRCGECSLGVGKRSYGRLLGEACRSIEGYPAVLITAKGRLYRT